METAVEQIDGSITEIRGVKGRATARAVGESEPFVDSIAWGIIRDRDNSLGDRAQFGIPGADAPVLAMKDKCSGLAIGEYKCGCKCIEDDAGGCGRGRRSRARRQVRRRGGNSHNQVTGVPSGR